MKNLKNVIVYDPTVSYEFFQSFYLDQNRMKIKPNCVVLMPPDMNVYFETNANGFKGPEIDVSKKLVGVWGDSVVFGIGKGWIEGLSNYFQQFQFLNGGIEGDPIENICKRAIEENQQIHFHHNIFFPGWHGSFDPNQFYILLQKTIPRLPGVILCTIPTSLNPDFLHCDLSPYFIKDFSEERYYFWGAAEYSISSAKALWENIHRRNSIIRQISEEHDLPLVDLYQGLLPDSLETFRNDFFDAGHPRPEAYPKWQQIFSEELKNVLG